jgi:hypothetical protein
LHKELVARHTFDRLRGSYLEGISIPIASNIIKQESAPAGSSATTGAATTGVGTAVGWVKIKGKMALL